MRAGAADPNDLAAAGHDAGVGAVSEDAGVSPSVALRHLITGYWVSQAVSVVAELGIADLLADGAKTSEELAGQTDTHAPSLFRLLRAVASVGVLHQLDDGRFGLTPMAECLRSDVPGSLRAYAAFFGGERQWRAWRNLAHSVATGETGYDHAFGLGLYDHLGQDPDAAEAFHRAMGGSMAHTRSAVVEAYDFSHMKRVVDVGGGNGSLLVAILEANPHLDGVVLDRPAVAELARRNLDSHGLAGRAEAVGGDLLDSVPVGADAYVMSRVVHVLDDDTSVAGLRSCAEAMAPGGRMLVVERVVPPGNDPSFAKLGDLNMLALTGGRERTEDEFAALFSAAGLRLTRVIPTRSEMSVIEARPAAS